MSGGGRQVTRAYRDPLDQIWLRCAARVGLRVERTGDAYATTDGRGVLLIGASETLDADDSLAQMILHELCHALVQGPEGLGRRDWGLDNESAADDWKEHACLRLQAHLTGRHGLRRFMAPTTDYRVSFWDGLGEDPFASAAGARDASVVAAKLAARRAERAPWTAVEEALQATARVAAAVGTGAAEDDSLWAVVDAVPARHPAGHDVVGQVGGRTCGDCGWRGAGEKCRVAGRKVRAAWAACPRWEPALDCLECGACCREAYHAVDVGPREAVVKRHPQLIVVDGEGRRGLRREGERCAALGGGRVASEQYACAIYDDRPRTCREFTLGSANCLDARRRVGLSL